ncbi:unnamed protein product [Amaranthus hypochondriacus]
MAPTQGIRIDSLEETVQDLQSAIPELQTNLDIRITKLAQQLEESQSRLVAEQNKDKEEMKESISLVMTELRKINSKVGSGGEREDSVLRDNQLFVKGGGFEIPRSLPR